MAAQMNGIVAAMNAEHFVFGFRHVSKGLEGKDRSSSISCKWNMDSVAFSRLKIFDSE